MEVDPLWGSLDEPRLLNNLFSEGEPMLIWEGDEYTKALVMGLTYYH